MSDIERVIIGQTDRTIPVYHRFADVEKVEHYGHRAVYACGHREPRMRWWSAHLRRNHADLFARPCRTCFKDES